MTELRQIEQLLLVQDGKLYGREPMFAVICKAALLPDGAKNQDIQKNKTVAQIGQLLITLLRVLCANIAWQRHLSSCNAQRLTGDDSNCSGSAGNNSLNLRVIAHEGVRYMEQGKLYLSVKFSFIS
ncbi:hypothetical protein ACS0TY_018664 [Phlomoides rotata]